MNERDPVEGPRPEPEARRSLATVREYLEEKRGLTLADHEAEFRKTIALLRRVKEFGPGADLLEIGSGSGWFTTLASREGYRAVGVEISWELVEFARRRAAEAGIAATFHESRAESLPLPDAAFDVAYANSVMEHVKGWREALREAHRVLRPGGLLFVGTTNRLYPISTEIDFPFYQWLPLAAQIRIALRKKGPDVMENGLAWNHFTPMGLRRALAETGFRQVLDVFDLVRPGDLRGVKRAAVPLLGLLRSSRAARIPLFTLISTTNLWALK
ncbi:MAG: class I SAM-dependent methyltransferase [Acidobacteria bacterium]|nr:class I SAM-dependent methyltransferase [Acidobacteriota bacterium]